MDRDIFMGDKVETPIGVGYVEDAQSWREKIRGMKYWQAREFSDRCRIDVGDDFKEKWIEVIVKIKGRLHRFLRHQVTILEGRDVKTES
jgi:hypothetical protein